MNDAALRAGLVILVGIVSTTQNHLAKAMERQGIEIFDLIRARIRRDGPTTPIKHGIPWIYVLGLVLNHTVFVYHLLVVPLGGTPALYTSMYGMGLIALLIYSTRVIQEKMGRLELSGAIAILLGTLAIGIEGIYRPPLDLGQIDPHPLLLALGSLFLGCVVLVVGGLNSGSPKALGLLFGLCAGTIGSLDPFLKGVAQAAGGGNNLLPGSRTGWIILVASFLIGELSFVITQWGYIRRARANILVPALNCSYVAVPVILQALLLPGYTLYWSTILGLGAIMGGIVLMRGIRVGRGAASDRRPGRAEERIWAEGDEQPSPHT